MGFHNPSFSYNIPNSYTRKVIMDFINNQTAGADEQEVWF